jgi:hypothetical protein
MRQISREELLEKLGSWIEYKEGETTVEVFVGEPQEGEILLVAHDMGRDMVRVFHRVSGNERSEAFAVPGGRSADAQRVLQPLLTVHAWF